MPGAGGTGLWAAPYTLGMWFTVVYLGDHYVVDIAIGAAYAHRRLAAHTRLLRVGPLRRLLGPFPPPLAARRRGAERCSTLGPMNDVRDLIIIGGACAGLTAAVYASRANLQPLCIEGFEAGGQLMITSDVENFPGFPEGVLGPDLMVRFREQAERFGTEFITDDVTSVDFSERPFRVSVGARSTAPAP